MNKIGGIGDIWKYNIIPFIGLKIFKINYFRSVCKEFARYIKPIKTPYLLVPSLKYPTIKDAYMVILEYICTKINYGIYDFIIPELWLKQGTHINNIFELNYPISVRGCCKHNTIIKNGLLYKIKDLYNKKIKISDLSLTNRNSRNDYYRAGINYSDYSCNSKLVIKNCKIFNCIGSGIKCPGGNIIIYNSEIYNNSTGIHLHGEKVNFGLKNLDVFNNNDGIVIGKLYNNKKYYLKNIRCFNNKNNGIGVGGCSSRGVVVISGDKTDIFNNGLNKCRNSAGISTTYDGIIWILDLPRNISHHNHNNMDYLQRFNSKILFKSSLT